MAHKSQIRVDQTSQITNELLHLQALSCTGLPVCPGSQLTVLTLPPAKWKKTALSAVLLIFRSREPTAQNHDSWWSIWWPQTTRMTAGSSMFVLPSRSYLSAAQECCTNFLKEDESSPEPRNQQWRSRSAAPNSYGRATMVQHWVPPQRNGAGGKGADWRNHWCWLIGFITYGYWFHWFLKLLPLGVHKMI